MSLRRGRHTLKVKQFEKEDPGQYCIGALFQLREEDNLPARVGLIAGTGTAGLMFGLLRGR